MGTAVVKFGNEPGDGLEVNAVTIRLDRHLGLLINRGDDGRVVISPIMQMMLALRQVVVDWSGPIFDGVRYRPSIWDDIDVLQCEWWIRAVFIEFTRLNNRMKRLGSGGYGG